MPTVLRSQLVVTQAKDKRNQTMAHDNQVRKDARKELRRLNGAEQKVDAEQENRMIEREQQEAIALQQVIRAVH